MLYGQKSVKKSKTSFSTSSASLNPSSVPSYALYISYSALFTPYFVLCTHSSSWFLSLTLLPSHWPWLKPFSFLYSLVHHTISGHFTLIILFVHQLFSVSVRLLLFSQSSFLDLLTISPICLFSCEQIGANSRPPCTYLSNVSHSYKPMAESFAFLLPLERSDTNGR